MLQDVHQILRVFRRSGGLVSDGAGDGENRALDRLDHALVSGRGCFLAGSGQVFGAVDVLVVQAAREPTPDLGEDDARVAACAHQCAVGHLAGYLPHVPFWAILDLDPGGLHRQHHVGSCVSIGNRVNVERVDGGLVVL